MSFDLIIESGNVVDGTDRPALSFVRDIFGSVRKINKRLFYFSLFLWQLAVWQISSCQRDAGVSHYD